MVEEFSPNFYSEDFTQNFESYGFLWNEGTKSDNGLMALGDEWDIGGTPTNDLNVENLASCSGIQLLNNEIDTDIGPVQALPTSTESNQPSPSASCVQYAPSSLPACQTWPGDYDFTVSFNPQPKTTKGVAWTYSKIKDKLYVGKDCPCPVNFSVSTALPSDAYVRVMALYTSPEQASEVVHRCVNHSMKESKSGIEEAEHLIRCESSCASYEIDSITKRHSVTVPFENPPAGQQFSTYIYKFTCFGSCAGGPNRRPLMLIFTLEMGNQVIGRRKLDVKICACPGRDKKTDESQGTKEENTYPATIKRKDTGLSVNLPPKKPSGTPTRDGLYDIQVDKKECAEFLYNMKKLYEVHKNFQNISPDVLKTMIYYQKKKSDEDSD